MHLHKSDKTVIYLFQFSFTCVTVGQYNMDLFISKMMFFYNMYMYKIDWFANECTDGPYLLPECCLLPQGMIKHL